MTKYKDMPSKGFIMERLHYNPASGLFTWMTNHTRSRPRQWTTAGALHGGGYVYISLLGYGRLAAHRLAWVYVHSEIPDGMEVDHIDGDTANNAISNLRLASRSQQMQNTRARRDNRSGFKGVIAAGKKWTSQICVGGERLHLGSFETAGEAHQAYGVAAHQHFGEFARTA